MGSCDCEVGSGNGIARDGIAGWDHVTARNVFSVAAHTHSLLFYSPLSLATLERSYVFFIGSFFKTTFTTTKNVGIKAFNL